MARSQVPHGTFSRYTNQGCRCADCRAANAARSAARRRAAGVPTRAELRARPKTHGIITRYNEGCRCTECRRASADAKSRQRVKAATREGREYGSGKARDWVLDYRLGRDRFVVS